MHMDFRDRLREEIEYSGLLNKEVAAKAGITKRAMDSYVGQQACMPAADVAVRLAKVLGVSVEYLVSGTKNSESFDSHTKEISHISARLSAKNRRLLLDIAKSIERVD